VLLIHTAGKKIPYSQRDAPWHTYTSRIGFPVMGIWPDASNRTDVNAVCRSRRGAPNFAPPPQGADKVQPHDHIAWGVFW
jgi:hypothetical protein